MQWVVNHRSLLAPCSSVWLLLYVVVAAEHGGSLHHLSWRHEPGAHLCAGLPPQLSWLGEPHALFSKFPFFSLYFALIIFWRESLQCQSSSWIWGLFVFSASVSGWRRKTHVPTAEFIRYCLISLFWPVGDAKRLEVFAKLEIIRLLQFYPFLFCYLLC